MEDVQKYLENDICKFTPLFKINPTRKQDIFTASFFKLHGGSYKNFGLYVRGIKLLSRYVHQKQPSYKIRLFIDRSIFNDRKIMRILKRLRNVQLVLYHCEEFVVNKVHHRGIFGTFVRYFPMFDFPNNDAGVVRNVDIDFEEVDIYRQDEIKKDLEKLKEIGVYDKIYYYASTRMYHVGIKGKFMIENKVVPYALSSKTVSLKRINPEVLTNFITSANKVNKPLTFYDGGHTQKKTLNKTFIFGADEYFLNSDLVKYMIKHENPFTVKYSYRITFPFYWASEWVKDMTEKEKKFMNIAIDFIVKDLTDIEGKSYQEKYEIIDQALYVERGSNKKIDINDQRIIDLVNKLYIMYEFIQKENLYFFPFTKDFIDFALMNRGVISKVVYVTHDKSSSNSVMTIERIDNKDIIKLEDIDIDVKVNISVPK